MAQSEAFTQTSANLKGHYRQLMRRRLSGLVLLVLLILVSITSDVLLGSSRMDIGQLYAAVFQYSGESGNMSEFIVWKLRIPAALIAVAVGLGLGLAGAEMQTILNNPLASPFTLGVSSAAAFGAALAMILQISIPGIPGHWIVSANAFLFALGSALLLDAVARWGGMNTTGIVLFGIALVFSFNALVSLMQYVASADALQELVFWTMGRLTELDEVWLKVGILLIAFAVILPWSVANSWRLTAMRLGEDRATSYGVNVSRVRLESLLRISILSALSVAFVGTIAFVGLVAPHIARRIFGEDHRFYLPGSALMGALILSLASIVSKNLVLGAIVPVGIVTALVGVPFFLLIVLRSKRFS